MAVSASSRIVLVTGSELGAIDMWVNNAMVSIFGRFSDVTRDEFQRVTDVTYIGTVNGTRVALD
jgi:NAD(P)-dependent dehydrogenase (short-subunit alcohol dehydrogenase family)